MPIDSKPKRAATSYMLFSNSVREELTQANRKVNGGKAKMAEVAKAISERWAKLADDEKAKFEEQAKKAKENHAAEMQAYKEANDPLAVLKEKYASMIPKKPMGAYWIFAQDESQRSKAEKALKEAGEEAAHKKIATKLGELWKAMSDADKAPWNEKARKATTEYEEKKKVWEATPEFIEFSKVEKEQKEKDKEEKAKEKAEAKEAAKEEKAAEREAKKAATEASPKKESATKRKATDGEGSSPEAKKAKVGKAGKAAKPQAPVIDADVLKKAESLGLAANLMNLISRPEVSLFPHAKLLAALEKSDGLVNKAKHVLLGGA